MRRTSALGCVARTVLMSGSSTGLSVVPRWAPSRASRRRTPTPEAATSAAWPCTAATAARARLVLAGPLVCAVLASAAAAAVLASAAAAAGLASAAAAAGLASAAAAAGLASAAAAAGPSAGPGSGTPAAPASACSASVAGSVSRGASTRAASAALVPVVMTSPATGAPHICQATILLRCVKHQITCARFPQEFYGGLMVLTGLYGAQPVVMR